MKYWREQYIPQYKSIHEKELNKYPMYIKEVTYYDTDEPIPTYLPSTYDTIKGYYNTLASYVMGKNNTEESEDESENIINDYNNKSTNSNTSRLMTMKVHYVHALSPRSDATPLIMLHGW